MNDSQAFEVLQLGYLGIAATDIPAWRAFAADYLGMQVVALDEGRLALRMDERPQRLLVEAGERDGLGFVGLELCDDAALRTAAARLEGAGLALEPAGPGELDIRGVSGMHWFRDPDGNRVELYHGPRRAPEPFVPGRPTGGFRTGALGLGHLVLKTPNYAAMKRLYMELLGFRLSDYLDTPFEASFMHVNPRHHSLAIIGSPDAGVHHLMVEYNYVDDVGRLYDMALQEPDRIAVTLGRHTNDHMLSFYSKTPGGFMVEAGWAGRLIRDDEWEPVKLSAPSLWGHERGWLPPAAREQARRQRDDLARQGVLAPTEAIPSPAFNVMGEDPNGKQT